MILSIHESQTRLFIIIKDIEPHKQTIILFGMYHLISTSYSIRRALSDARGC